jgi:hypothetical protein
VRLMIPIAELVLARAEEMTTNDRSTRDRTRMGQG